MGGRGDSQKKGVLAGPAPANIHQFISDFFRTDIMNHCEFLKCLSNVDEDGENDAFLIAEICERLASQTEGKKAEPMDPPFYGGDDAVSASAVGHVSRLDFQKHKSFPRNCYNIIMVYASLSMLRGHEYNIYELAYLHYHSKIPFRTAVLIFVIQIIVLGVVVQYNFSEYEVAFKQRDRMVILVDVCQTIFFVAFCYGQYSRASTFTQAVRGVIGGYNVADEDLVIKIDNPSGRGKWQPELMLFMNTFINQYCLVFAPLFNFYFILMSDTAMDALLNSFSLLFIFELDDYILPIFEGVDIKDKLVVNAHDFIMIPPVKDDLTCKRTGPELVPDGSKLYVSLVKEKKSIIVYRRSTATKYEKTTYSFGGLQAGKFLSMCDEALDCLQHFKDIHD